MSHIIVCPFFDIKPIDNVEEGISRGGFNDHHRHITNKTVPLRPTTGTKNLYVICFDRIIERTEYVDILLGINKQSCRDAPQYLLGLMTEVPENKMPPLLRNKNIVAAETDNSNSVFVDADGHLSFLYVHRGPGHRELIYTGINRKWLAFSAFLAEDLKF